MKMILTELFDILDKGKIDAVIGSLDQEIVGFELDSRKVEAGEAFIALKGAKVDGHDFIDDVIYRGCKVIICEYMPEVLPGITYIVMKDARADVGILVNHFYGNTKGSIKLIGVTGTNGKSTIATLLYQLFTQMGYLVGLISTVENKIGSEVLVATHTTPDVVNLAKLIRDMRMRGCSHIFMEVSSHGLDQGRVAGLYYDGGVFSNITHDHLDYHGTMLNYINAKKKLFDGLSQDAFAITNADDKNGLIMVQNCGARVKKYALKTLCDFHTRILQDSIYGLHLKINDHEVYFRLSGEFNAYNITSVYATAVMLGEKEGEILTILSRLSGAEGRMQKIVVPGKKVIGIVDYAHTPDALNNVLTTLRNTVDKSNRIITVVGCGGDRDKTKRPEMARIAVEKSDQVVMTSDNPRSENPELILDDMEKGVVGHAQGKHLRISDRLSAIKTAVMLAKPGDVVLVAGKGHEKYQETMGEKLPFEDIKVLEDCIEQI